MNNIILFLIAIIGMIVVSPKLTYLVPTSVKLSIIVITSVLILLKTYLIISPKYQNLIKYSIIISLMIGIYWLLGISSAKIGNVYNQVSFFLFVIIAIYIRFIASSRNKQLLLIFFWVYILINIIDNIILYNQYKLLIHTALEKDIVGTNWGGTSFNTLSFVYFSANLFILFNVNKTYIKILALIASVISMYYMFFCGSRGTVVLLDLYMLFIIPIIFYCKEFIINKGKSIIFLILFFIVFVDFSPLIDLFISISPERLARRFEDLKYTTEEGLSDQSFSGRYGLYWISIESWFKDVISFLFGIGDHRGTLQGEVTYQDAGIGGHSEFLDHCARFGLIGLFFLVNIFKRINNLYVSYFQTEVQRLQIKYILYGFLICSCIKAVFSPHIGFVFFIFFSLTLSFVQNNRINK